VRHAVPLLHDTLFDAAARSPREIAIVARGERLSYAELAHRVASAAHALARRGVGRGDRVLVFADDPVLVVTAFFGALAADAVACVVHPQTKADKLRYLLEDSGAAALVCEARLAPSFEPAIAASALLRAVLVAGPASGPLFAGTPPRSRWEAALGEHPGDAPPRRRGIDADLAALVYTSGSTGDAKGVMLTHRNMRAAAASIGAYLGLDADDAILCALPLSFDYGLYQPILAFQAGARVVLERSFTYPADVLATAAREGVTVFPGVPTMFALLGDLAGLGGVDLSRVRTVTNTAAALAPKHVETIRRVFPRARLFSMYGLTECKRCTYLPPEDLDRKPGSVGVAIPNTEVWIEGEHGARLGPGLVGELVVRGATVMRGYWGKPEETAKKLRPGPLPGEVVLHTGDLCTMDADGYVHFVARMDDVIKSRGEKVAPKEVEAALVDVPGVREAAVVGVPDEVLGQAVKAFVVLEEGAALDERDLVRACQDRLEDFKVPKHVVIVASLSRTSTGKIRKAGLA
jgi:amino acid adenylation domain-containing protein